MANKTLFQTLFGKLGKATAVNEAGGSAYELPPRHQLAQYAATGCLNQTFYTSAEEQLETVLNLCRELDPKFLAKVAIYTRNKAHMKDMPALICAILASRDGALLSEIFPRVIDNGKMLRNFVQIIRSGMTGRSSLGTLPKRLVRQWLESHSDEAVFRASVGNNPSMADIIKMVHPNPDTPSREALYGWMLDRDYNNDVLPQVVKDFEDFKSGKSSKVPSVPFLMLTALTLGTEEWIRMAKNMGWQALRMNLNTLKRHGVLEDKEMVEYIAKRISDREEIGKARVFPYQLMMAWMKTRSNINAKISNALQDAMEIAMDNVPPLDGKVYIFPDVSGSMSCPVTGYRTGSSSQVRCVDVAALFASAILRKNPEAEVIPFEFDVCDIDLNPRDSVVTNAQKLSSILGGGTNCSAPLSLLNKQKAKGDLIIYISDNESWVDSKSRYCTETMRQWNFFKKRNPRARMACIDIQPYRTVQTMESTDVLNIGGFSDAVFDVIGTFAKNGMDANHWVKVIEETKL